MGRQYWQGLEAPKKEPNIIIWQESDGAYQGITDSQHVLGTFLVGNDGKLTSIPLTYNPAQVSEHLAKHSRKK